MLNDPELVKDKLYGYSIFSGNVYAIACGYFFWDIWVCVYQIPKQGWGFTVHGVACFLVFLFSFVNEIYNLFLTCLILFCIDSVFDVLWKYISNV